MSPGHDLAEHDLADHDLAVVGAGPAGLAAATCAAGLGLDVVLLDEQAAPGGRVYRNIEGLAETRPCDLEALWARYRAGLSLTASFRASGARYQPETAVWMIEADGTLGLRDAAGASLLSARRVVVATGAMERAVPIPGWTLPGVMTVGAAQTLLKASALVPETPPVIAGSGPLVLLYAAQLLAIGGAIGGILDTTPPGNRVKALPRLPGLLGHLGALRQGLGWQRAIEAAGVPVFKGAREIEAMGDGRVEAVEFLSGGRRRRIETRLLLLHEGVVPDHHLAMSADCA
ncbi:MAG: FAD-dependent oxidoreductase, partial [Planctomycetota bacterium]